MTDFIIYLLKSGIVVSIFYGLYVLLLRKETFYNFNRVYLLVTLFISFILPFVNIQLEKSTDHVVNNFVNNVEYAFVEVTNSLEYAELKAAENVSSYPLIYFIVLLGMIFTIVRIGFQLFSIHKNVKKYGIKTHGKYMYVLMDNSYPTHSFFNFIFVQKSDYKNSLKKEVLLHEHVHADQWHSLDLLVVGFLSILQWFNPFIYLYKRALTETHEFQADQVLLDKGTDKVYYQQLLLGQARSIVFAGLTSNFNQSLIKNRLKMMNKIKSKNRVLAKYFAVVPVVVLVSTLFAVSQNNIEDTIGKALTYENGKLYFGFSNFDNLNYQANDSIEMDMDKGLITLYGDALAETLQSSIKSDVLYIDTKNNTVYTTGYTTVTTKDDYIPSILPIDEANLKRITSGFGMRMHPILKVERMHNGIDFSAATGTPVKSTANGIVRIAEYAKSYGNRVIIDHGNGFSTNYTQLTKYIVKGEQRVKKGEVIGYVGSTGLSTAPHLHYEIMKDGEYIDPKDYLGDTSQLINSGASQD